MNFDFINILHTEILDLSEFVSWFSVIMVEVTILIIVFCLLEIIPT